MLSPQSSQAPTPASEATAPVVLLTLRAQYLPDDPASPLRALTAVAISKALGVNASDLVVSFQWQAQGTLVSVAIRTAKGYSQYLSQRLTQDSLDRQTAVLGLGSAVILGEGLYDAKEAGAGDNSLLLPM